MAIERITINGKALKEELKKRNLIQTQVERDLGLGGGTFGHAFKDGYISKQIITLLKYEYGIMPESYVIKEETKEEPKAAPETVNVNVNVSSEAIESALINVLANEEVRKQITMIIYFAVNKALRNNSGVTK